ncbi:hypothetical protein [Streptomyces sp. NPDC001985]|uniref:hypothetical protein n=1 Tax=Streptomyces sp. NPDC001985 TaxID=3154406 RepID=UPI0033196B88
MTKRVMTLLGAVACAFLLSAAVPAASAEGFLIVDRDVHANPSGCLLVGDAPDFLEITNQTTRTVVAHLGSDCTGAVTAVLAPGATGVFWAASISVEDAV